MTLQWLAVDIATRKIVCDLPGLESTDPFRRTIGTSQTSTATLTVTDSTDPSWERGVLEGASAVLAYDGPVGGEMVLWGGLVLQSPRTLGNTVQLSLITGEGILDRCWTGAYSVTNRDQNLIVTDLVNQFVVTRGFPFGTRILGAAGTARTQQFNDYDDKTVYSTLTDLSGLSGGPEWTVEWAWDHTTQLITPVLNVGTRIGSSPRAGLAPAVTFDETQMTDALIPHDWSSGAGANVVTATSGQGLARPIATSTAADFNGRGRYEYRYSPSTSVSDPLTLQQHAAQALAIMQYGNQAVSFTVANNLPGFQLGIDWFLGDDIGYTIQSPTIPNRVTGVGRCIGYELTDTTVKPILFTQGVS